MEAPSRITVAVAAATLVVAAASLLAAGSGAPARRAAETPPRAPTTAPTPRVNAVSEGVGLLSARSGATVAFVSGELLPRPAEAVHDGGSFWVFDVDPPTFVQIDPVTGSIIRRLPSPVADVGFFTVDSNVLWITDATHGDVTAIDATDGRTLRRFRRLPGRGGSAGVVMSHGSLWVARPEAANGDGILLRLDPRTGRVERLFRALPGTYDLSAEPDGTVWSGGTFGAVNRIDPVTNTIVRAVTEGRNYSIAAGDGVGWTANTLNGVVYEVDANGDVTSQVETAPGARSVAYSDGVVWVGNRETGMVTRIDSAGHISTFRFDHDVISLAAGSGIVLVGFGAPALTAAQSDPDAH
jgi:streptogramin lyase